ncbi:MAG: T9SS type A sorting domain-containing protein [Ignavibacteriae bacterium]|nr:T9SS C-terminal target domain-containing protein [Ignavibacteriota bacterium]NOG96738.1 T9SS type A sorting domain-containing protein [Ignavibacteriota bacterium]
MKNKFNIQISLILVLLIASVTINSNLSAQSLFGIKICIDPGHGGHDPANDRYIPETGFWESDGNFSKALFLRDILEDLGAVVILTRLGNDDSDDISLSARRAVANSNGVDYFHSIHSNGFNGQSNYTLMLFNGTDGSPTWAQAKQMGAIMSPQIKNAHRTTAHYNRGDVSFLGFNLGVLNGTSMPATLSEGSFHDYIPESWRLRNDVYKKHEAWAIARSFMDYFNAGDFTSGEIAGILRDPLENVPYYYISSLGDAKRPLNQIQVTLEPGNIQFEGDDFNNGFFLFDELSPGEYTVYFNVDDYAFDSVAVNVLANSTVFADKNLPLDQSLSAPSIIDFYPGLGSPGISLSDDIELLFDIRMNKASVENAITITPGVDSTLSWPWAYKNKKLIINPIENLLPGTVYEVKISTDAESIFGVPLAEEFSFNFTTRSNLTILSAYPDFNSIEISPTVEIRLEFDAPIFQQSLAGNIGLFDGDNNELLVNVDISSFQRGEIIFEPKDPLNINTAYQIRLLSGITDTEGLTLGQDYFIDFVTEAEGYTNGTILDDMESIGTWQEPEQSTTSVGIVEGETNFTIVSSRNVLGDKSGRLTYTFNSTGGICRVNNTSPIAIGTNAASNFGIWVFGDLSYNEIEYWFVDAGSNNVEVLIDTLDWTGWKMKFLPIGDIPGSGEKQFHSFVINQTENGNLTGELFFDGVQSDVVTDIGENGNTIVTDYKLFQNYPNPFNPSTVIKYSLLEAGLVNIKIYDILGNEIATLLNGEKNAGSHSIEFNAANYASGVYFYKISSGSFVSVKKMMLLK